MEIFTDVYHGEAALAPFLSELTGKWELIGSGEASESPFHQWDCAFYLQRSPGGRLYALQLIDFGDLSNEDGKNNDPDPIVKVVAVWPDPPTEDEGAIACTFLSTYQQHGGKYIELFNEVGRFDLESLWKADDTRSSGIPSPPIKKEQSPKADVQTRKAATSSIDERLARFIKRHDTFFRQTHWPDAGGCFPIVAAINARRKRAAQVYALEYYEKLNRLPSGTHNVPWKNISGRLESMPVTYPLQVYSN